MVESTSGLSIILGEMGPLTDEDAKELVSFCLINLHAADRRINMAESRFDRTSTDICYEITVPNPPPSEYASASLRVQAKCTSSPKFVRNGKYLSFPLSIKNYNDLTARKSERHILIVAVLDGEITTCMSLKCPYTIKARLFYTELKGMPQIVGTTQKTKSVHIDASSELNSDLLLNLLEDVRTLKWIA